ncbi:MAG: hypothetical protein M1426_01455 [Patescibacteria group bacterium]|nr:hypothetical protein [Patescibacteria group bacterium]
MKKLIFLIPFLFFLAFVKNVYASDFIFTCSDSGCASTTNSALFSSSNLSPGETVNRSVNLVNKTNQHKKFAVRVTNYLATGDLDKNIQFVITRISDNSIIYNHDFFEFAHAGEVFLVELSGNSEDNVNFTATFLALANNDYQDKSVNFDLEFGLITDDTSPSIGGDDNTGSADTSTSEETTSAGGVITPFASATYRQLFDGLKTDDEILGIQAATPSSIDLSHPQVLAKKCFNPLWWLVLMVCYELLSRNLRNKFKKNIIKNLITAQFILALTFLLLSWKIFCWWILIVLAIIFGVFDLFRLHRLNH